jgi:hypothetical protein
MDNNVQNRAKKAGDKRRSAVKELAFLELDRLYAIGQVDHLARRLQQWSHNQGYGPIVKTEDQDENQMRKFRGWVQEHKEDRTSPPKHDEIDEAVRELKSWIESELKSRTENIDGGEY